MITHDDLDVLVDNYRALEIGPAPGGAAELRRWKATHEPSLEQAYEWQREVLAAIGSRWPCTHAGYKISMVAEEDRADVSAPEPAYGVVFESNIAATDLCLPLDRLNRPLLEPELQLRNSRPLTPDMSIVEMTDSLEVAGGIEVPVSRVVDWQAEDRSQMITLGEFVADNAGMGWLVIGEVWRPAGDVPLTDIPVVMATPAGDRLEGHSSRVAGNPVAALKWLVEKLAAHGVDYPAGLITSSGTFRPPTFARIGEFVAEFGAELGTVSVSFA